MKYEENKDGYIVFECSGDCPMAYGASERWFPTYGKAMKYATESVEEETRKFKNRVDENEVIVYEGAENILHTPHEIPCGRVVFNWKNFYIGQPRAEQI